jgi:hypothetical protein
MANKCVSIVVRGRFEGKRVNWSLKRAKQAGLTGTYWTKWLVGSKAQWAGPFKDEWVAKASQSAKARELRTGISAATND